MKNKKILISSILICILLFIGIGFNFLFSSANKDEIANTSSSVNKVEQEELSEEKSEEQVKNTEEVKKDNENNIDSKEKEDKETVVAVEEKVINEASNYDANTHKVDTANTNKSNFKPNSNTNVLENEEIKNETKEESVNYNTVDNSNNLGTTTNTPSIVEPQKQTVKISISCKTAINKGVNKEPGFTHLPSNGVILGTTTVEIKEGETVFEVLEKVVRQNKIHMEYSGSGNSIYIEGIDNLYEFDGGQNSGWMYSVNGWYPNYGCGVYKLKPNDVIEWNYTCDLGADLGANSR